MKVSKTEAIEDRSCFPMVGSSRVDIGGLAASGPRHDREATATAVLEAPQASLVDPLVDPAASLEASAAVKMYDTREAAAYLGMSVPCLAKWRMEGKGPRYVKYEKKVVRYPKKELDEYIWRNTV